MNVGRLRSIAQRGVPPIFLPVGGRRGACGRTHPRPPRIARARPQRRQGAGTARCHGKHTSPSALNAPSDPFPARINFPSPSQRQADRRRTWAIRLMLNDTARVYRVLACQGAQAAVCFRPFRPSKAAAEQHPTVGPGDARASNGKASLPRIFSMSGVSVRYQRPAPPPIFLPAPLASERHRRSTPRPPTSSARLEAPPNGRRCSPGGPPMRHSLSGRPEPPASSAPPLRAALEAPR
jgi:hypothetical protein